MIKQATAGDVARLIAVNDDNLTDVFIGKRGQIIQHLVQVISSENPNLRIWINEDGNEINAYVIAINNVMLPLSDNIFIAHAYSKAGSEVTKEMLDYVIEWGISLEATSISMATKVPEHFVKYGFQSIEFKLMELQING